MDIGSIGSSPETSGAQPALPAKHAADLERARAACKDFESILLYQMLTSMRQALASEDEANTDFGGDLFRSMIDEQLGVALARGGGIGLAKLLEQGLGLGEKDAAGIGDLEAALRVETETREAATPACGPEETTGPKDPADAGTDAGAKAGAVGPAAASGEPAPQPVRLEDLVGHNAAGRHGGTSRALLAYESTIKAAAKVFGLSADLIRAVILHESGGNPQAVSSKGAKGLMQLTDATARTLGVTNPFNPVQNIFGGARYLGSLLKMFGGDLKLALASYNAGSGAVKKYGGIPPYKETQDYVNKVIESYQRLSAGTEGTGHVYKS